MQYQRDITIINNERMCLNKNKDSNQSAISDIKVSNIKVSNINASNINASDIKVRSNSDDEYNNMIQKQQDEVMRILNNHDDTQVNESSFDPSKSSPPNDFMRKLQNRYHKFAL